jgi:hypothetical protein
MDPRLASSGSLIETAWSWCGSVNWTNMMSVLLKALALGTAGALAEPCTIGIPDVPLSFDAAGQDPRWQPRRRSGSS